MLVGDGTSDSISATVRFCGFAIVEKFLTSK